jgi:hypothetical protein
VRNGDDGSALGHFDVPAEVSAGQFLAAIVDVGDEAVQRHRHVSDDLAHDLLLHDAVVMSTL